MHETRTTEPTPEQLLKMLDLQLDQQRSRRRRSGQSRTTVRVAGIALILGGLIAALLLLQMAVSGFLPQAGAAAAAETAEEISTPNF